MKKILKIVLIIIISILTLWFAIYLIDNFRYRKGNKPLIVLNTNNYIYFDGTVTEYESIGYKLIEYNRKSIKEKSLKPIWKKIIDDTNSIYLMYNKKENCDQKEYVFYEDDEYKYSLDCYQDIDVIQDKKKYPLSEAIEKDIITTDELENYITVNKQNK